NAAICFYGIPPKGFADPAKIRVPFQGHFANEDDWCTPAAVNDLEQVLRGASIKHEIHRYDAAHAFANERGVACVAARATQAWDRMPVLQKTQIAWVPAPPRSARADGVRRYGTRRGAGQRENSEIGALLEVVEGGLAIADRGELATQQVRRG